MTKTPEMSAFIRKGEATPVAPKAAGRPAAAPAEAPASERKSRSLTLKLSERNYQLLREYAHKHEQTHQDVIERALLAVIA